MREKKLIYEIPVYSVSEEEFIEKWDKRKTKIIRSFMEHGHKEESANQGFKDCYYPQYLWKYNQIVGYINISVTNQDVDFKLFCTLDKNIRAISSKKHFIQDWRINGMHFYALHKDNGFLRENIKSLLQEVKAMLPKRYYVDDSSFRNTIDCMDIMIIMESLDRN